LIIPKNGEWKVYNYNVPHIVTFSAPFPTDYLFQLCNVFGSMRISTLRQNMIEMENKLNPEIIYDQEEDRI
jgi:hypothetical protein